MLVWFFLLKQISTGGFAQIYDSRLDHLRCEGRGKGPGEIPITGVL